MKLRTDKTNKVEIYTSAINDIMFFLLLFFIIVSTLLNTEIIKLTLPKAQTAEIVKEKPITISINKNLEYFINDKLVDFSQLQNALAAELGDERTKPVILRCDSSVTVQHLVNVLEIGNALDVKIPLATKKNRDN